jgi:aminotransferase
VAKHKDLIVLSDEIWSDIIFSPNTFNSFASIGPVFDQTITVTGYSKSYGLAGLRIGSVLCPNKKIFDQILESSLHQSTVHGANVLGQIAATAALNDAQVWLSSFVEHLHGMRNLAVQRLNEMPGVHCKSPEGCYVLFPDISQTPYSASELHKHLLDKAKVAVVPGLPKWFGSAAEGHIRLSFATSEELLTEALDRIHKFLDQ